MTSLFDIWGLSKALKKLNEHGLLHQNLVCSCSIENSQLSLTEFYKFGILYMSDPILFMGVLSSLESSI
jgi:hypothetical protein